ncbi:hypothetical protein AALA61_01285 [Oscillospiraceae bacterium 42-9]|jgi:phage baseplate assembly protein W|uniref:hypothetical protein n=1 Tax=Acutalibacter sp. TaxID=1918636 RepID=UPI0021723160|nr:hypothetical protein [Acutalibacter sp.]
MSKKGAARRKPGIGAKLLLGVVTMINLALTLALALERRREVVRAVNSQEGRIQLLLEKEAKETK